MARSREGYNRNDYANRMGLAKSKRGPKRRRQPDGVGEVEMVTNRNDDVNLMGLTKSSRENETTTPNRMGLAKSSRGPKRRRQPDGVDEVETVTNRNDDVNLMGLTKSSRENENEDAKPLSLIHISEPTRLRTKRRRQPDGVGDNETR